MYQGVEVVVEGGGLSLEPYTTELLKAQTLNSPLGVLGLTKPLFCNCWIACTGTLVLYL